MSWEAKPTHSAVTHMHVAQSSVTQQTGSTHTKPIRVSSRVWNLGGKYHSLSNAARAHEIIKSRLSFYLEITTSADNVNMEWYFRRLEPKSVDEVVPSTSNPETTTVGFFLLSMYI